MNDKLFARLRTVGAIARELTEKLSREKGSLVEVSVFTVSRIIRDRGIPEATRGGVNRLFDSAAQQQIETELRRRRKM
jgi:hypothetical protein